MKQIEKKHEPFKKLSNFSHAPNNATSNADRICGHISLWSDFSIILLICKFNPLSKVFWINKNETKWAVVVKIKAIRFDLTVFKWWRRISLTQVHSLPFEEEEFGSFFLYPVECWSTFPFPFVHCQISIRISRQESLNNVPIRWFSSLWRVFVDVFWWWWQRSNSGYQIREFLKPLSCCV